MMNLEDRQGKWVGIFSTECPVATQNRILHVTMVSAISLIAADFPTH